MTVDEKTIETLETEFPSLSGSAFSAAYRETLKSGLSVMVVDGDKIYEVFPDGHREERKMIDPPTPVIPGTRISLS